MIVGLAKIAVQQLKIQNVTSRVFLGHSQDNNNHPANPAKKYNPAYLPRLAMPIKAPAAALYR